MPCWGARQDLHLSHQALADELGTVREMVTRLLRRFEREGWLTLGGSTFTSSTARPCGTGQRRLTALLERRLRDLSHILPWHLERPITSNTTKE